MKIIRTFLLLFFLSLLNSCQTIEDKTDKIGKKEIKELSQFLQQPESELKMEMGQPDKINYDEKGSKFYIYKKKNMELLVKKSLK